ncbi:MAG: glutathione peroxidase [Corynebacterium sp.]|uniref:glutathione peroxidase n=1 Tax=Corynebacterium sp. TaxID=1720 RepID=UPI0026DD09C4|nr:glutathione peroxidase [Corynebacterium sp.]MDO5030664.1 glutathione peroxidase [Corynebacterium sp.]
MSELFDIRVTTIDGKETTLKDWEGHVLLIVNTASECGFTDQYDGLQALFDELAPRGFFVLGFPCNQFGGQEPGSAEEIKAFCQREFGVTFPLFEKIEVNGDNEHPLYSLLKQTPDADGEAGDVKWNFEKFVISPAGKVVGRFRSKVEPDDENLRDLIEDNLPI